MGKPSLRTGEIIVLVIVILSFGLSIFYYLRLPEQMSSHWISEDRLVTGYPSKLFPTIVTSLIMVAILIAYTIIPRLRSKAPDERFRYYDRLLIWLFAFWFFCQLTTPIPRSFNQTKAFLMISIGSLFFLLGDTFAHAKKGWFVSIANRWTLKQPSIWETTHRNIGWSFKAAAIFCLLQALLPMPYIIYPIGVCLLFVYYYIFFYSYFANRKLKKKTTIEVPPNTGKRN